MCDVHTHIHASAHTHKHTHTQTHMHAHKSIKESLQEELSANWSEQLHCGGFLHLPSGKERWQRKKKTKNIDIKGVGLQKKMLLTLFEKSVYNLVWGCTKKSSVTLFQNVFVIDCCACSQGVSTCSFGYSLHLFTGLQILNLFIMYWLLSMFMTAVLVHWATTAALFHTAMTTALVHWAMTTALVRMFRYMAPRNNSKTPIMNAPANSK